MRLMLVHDKGSALGGAELYLLNAAESLNEHFDVSFVTDRGAGDPDPVFHESFDRIHAISFADGQEFRDLIRQEKADLLYFHKCVSPSLLEAALASGVPAVRMVHDHDIYCMRTYKYFPWSRRICTKTAGPCCIFPCLASVQRRGWVSYSRQMRLRELDRMLSAHFVGSNFMKEELVRQGYDSRKVFIFPPVPKPLPHPVASNFSERNLILFVGQVVRGKGLDVLLSALSRIDRPYHLVVFGEGSHRPFCEGLSTRLGIRDRVDFRGFVEREAMEFAFKEATLLAFPSVWPEPFGRTGLEAMEHGLPVVGFDSGGVKDWLKHDETGFLIPWMDIAGMAEGIEILLSDKARAGRMGEAGRRMSKTHFDFEATGRAAAGKLAELAYSK